MSGARSKQDRISAVRRPLLSWATAVLALLTPLTSLQGQNFRSVDLSRLVVIGDSLAAGFQNNSLLGTQQVHGFSALFARQAGTLMTLPLVAAPGIPNVLMLSPDGTIVTAPGVSAGLVPGQRSPTNFAIPGARVIDTYVRNPVFGSGELLSTLILGPPINATQPTQVSRAVAENPTTIIAWIGNNDVLLPALYYGTTASITDQMAFDVHYTQMLWHLQRSGATIVVANIPNILDTPVFTPIEAIAAQASVPLTAVCAALGQPPACGGSYVTIFGVSAAQQILRDFAQTQVPGSLPSSLVLTPEEAATVRETISAYNAIIARLARTNGAVLVDINALVADLHRNGIVVSGQRLTTAPFAGLFSLDAIHPSNTGYALIANEFIRTLNREAGTAIPLVSVEQVAASDPLVPRRVQTTAGGM